MRARLFAVTLVVVAVSCLTVWSAAPAAESYSATVVAQKVSEVAGDQWVYTVSNTSTNPDYVIWLLQIEVDEQTITAGASSPQYWHVDLDVPGLVFWSTSQSGGYVQSGSSNDGFQASYESEPAYQYWTVMFKNITVPEDTPVEFGDVIVPEPGAAAGIFVGLVSLAAQLTRRRERK